MPIIDVITILIASLPLVVGFYFFQNPCNPCDPCTEECIIQSLRPDSDVTVTKWEDQSGGTTNLWDVVNEVVADDSDYIINTDDTLANLRYTLTDGDDPGVDTDHLIRVRVKSPQLGPGEGIFSVFLYQGATLIVGFNPDFGTVNVFTTITLVVPNSNAANISDYSDLRINLSFLAPNAGDQCLISWIELEFPCA